MVYMDNRWKTRLSHSWGREMSAPYVVMVSRMPRSLFLGSGSWWICHDSTMHLGYQQVEESITSAAAVAATLGRECNSSNRRLEIVNKQHEYRHTQPLRPLHSSATILLLLCYCQSTLNATTTDATAILPSNVLLCSLLFYCYSTAVLPSMIQEILLLLLLLFYHCILLSFYLFCDCFSTFYSAISRLLRVYCLST